MIHGKLRTSDGTTIYGYINDLGLNEVFATNPHCVGASELKAGTLHNSVEVTHITRREFNGAFLFQMPDEISEADARATFLELRKRYPE